MSSKTAGIAWNLLCEEYEATKKKRLQVMSDINSKYAKNEGVTKTDFETYEKAENNVSEILERMHAFCLDKNNYRS